MNHVRDLVSTGRRITELGLSSGSSGNISVRRDETIVMSPTGSNLGALDPATMSVVGFDGTLQGGARPSKEFPFHRAFYRRDDACQAVVHVHSPAALAVSCLTPWEHFSAIPPITPYFVMRVGQTPLVPYADPGDRAQADYIEALPFPVRAVLLQNHGLVTSGTTLQEALEAAVELEQTCETLLRLGQQQPNILTNETARRLGRQYGAPWTEGMAP